MPIKILVGVLFVSVFFVVVLFFNLGTVHCKKVSRIIYPQNTEMFVFE